MSSYFPTISGAGDFTGVPTDGQAVVWSEEIGAWSPADVAGSFDSARSYNFSGDSNQFLNSLNVSNGLLVDTVYIGSVESGGSFSMFNTTPVLASFVDTLCLVGANGVSLGNFSGDFYTSAMLVQTTGNVSIGSEVDDMAHVLQVYGASSFDGGLIVTDGSGNLTLDTLILANYTVSGLPSPGTPGRVAYATNARKPGQLTGFGTGRMVEDDGTGWFTGDGLAVAS